MFYYYRQNFLSLMIFLNLKYIHFLKNHLFDKWDYIYFKYNLKNHICTNNCLKDFNFKFALKSDLRLVLIPAIWALS